MTDFSGLDAGIHRDGTLRTEQFDPKHLNGETFKPNKKLLFDPWKNILQITTHK